MKTHTLIKRAICGIILSIGISSPIFAQYSNELDAAIGLHTTQNPGLQNNVKTPVTGTKVPGYSTGGTSSQENLYQDGNGNTVGPGTVRTSVCSYTNTDECEAVNTMVNGPLLRPEPVFSAADPLFTNLANIELNVDSILGPDFVGPEGNSSSVVNMTEICETESTEVPDKFRDFACTIEAQTSEEVCNPVLNVNVDKDWVFKCQRSEGIKRMQSCNTYLRVTCVAGGDGCDAGGIVPGTVAADMEVKLVKEGDGSQVLEFGVIGDDYWVAGTSMRVAKIYERVLEFDINNIDKITQFLFEWTLFDDWLELELNGHVFFRGPKLNADRHELFQREDCMGVECNGTVTRWYVRYGPGPNDIGNSEYHWNSGTNNVSMYPNIDLRPFLKNGKNVMKASLIVSGAGEMFMKFRTKQSCPDNCSAGWDVSQCEALLSRT